MAEVVQSYKRCEQKSINIKTSNEQRIRISRKQFHRQWRMVHKSGRTYRNGIARRTDMASIELGAAISKSFAGGDH